MKKKIALFICTVLLASQTAVPSLADAGVKEQAQLAAVMEEINGKNMELDAPGDSTSQYRYNYKNNKSKFSQKDNTLMWKSYDSKKVKKQITAAQAKKEVQWLFRLLRSQYGLYTYYGGDVEFGKAKAAILKDIGTEGTIKTQKYQKLLHKHLGFITDNHLAMGEELFGSSVRLFGDESIHYVKIGEQFFAEENPEDSIISIHGEQPDTYLKRAIDEEGRLTYYPYAMLEQEGDSCSLEVTYQSGQTQNITLRPAEYSFRNTVDRMYGYDKYDDAAYVEMNLAYMEGEFPNERRQFLEDAADMKNQKNLIFDLRNNPGGDGSLVDEWFQNYTGSALLPNYSTLRIRPVWINNKKELQEMDAFAVSYGLEKSGKYYYIQNPGHQYLENEDRQIFVLTSRHTSSAAEALTDALRNIENTVVIGTNTGGVLLNMANYSMAMPYSGLFLQFGECMQHFDESYFKEAYGMEPDIYLTGKNLDQRLEKFFEIYCCSSDAPEKEA